VVVGLRGQRISKRATHTGTGDCGDTGFAALEGKVASARGSVTVCSGVRLGDTVYQQPLGDDLVSGSVTNLSIKLKWSPLLLQKKNRRR
jgi:hypothetical protein